MKEECIMDVKEFMKEEGLDKVYRISREKGVDFEDLAKVYILKRLDGKPDIGGPWIAVKKDGEIVQCDAFYLIFEGIV